MFSNICKAGFVYITGAGGTVNFESFLKLPIKLLLLLIVGCISVVL
jgi:hypothetical protein